MSRTVRRSKRTAARRYTTLSTLGAIGAATEVGLGGAVPAHAQPADGAQARSSVFSPRALAGGLGERAPQVGPVERAPQRGTVVYTVRRW